MPDKTISKYLLKQALYLKFDISASFREILSLGWDFDYVMNISESDLPVRPVETFEAHLASRMGRNFVAYSKVNMVTFHDGQGLSKVGAL
jgi:hypothetical protein